MTYGQAENADIAQVQGLLPIGLAEGCRLKRNLNKDQVLTYGDVELPKNRLCDQLREEQNVLFGSAQHDESLATYGNQSNLC